MVDGEGNSIVVKSDVDLGRGRSNDMVLHPGEDFFDVTWAELVVGSRQ